MACSEDLKFLSWVSPDGNLSVIGMAEPTRTGMNRFKVVCKICSQDPELFPKGYFISAKSSLLDGLKPCGCGKSPRWEPWQYLIRVRRKSKDILEIIGFAEEFHGNSTKVLCKRISDGKEIQIRLNSLLKDTYHVGMGSGGRTKIRPDCAVNRCKTTCAEENYKFIGFIGEYINNKSKFEYECPLHGVQITNYANFITSGARCPECATNGYNPNKPGSFYITRWTKDDHSFIKFGITNSKVITRIKQQFGLTEYSYEILYSKDFNDGHIPLKIEKSIKADSSLIIGIIDKVKFKSGFTETVREQDLNILLRIVETLLEDNH